MEVPKPTVYERKLASRLVAEKIPHKSQPVIWYTRANYYTPDFCYWAESDCGSRW